MRLIYHADAKAELIESARFYEQQVPLLGGQFLNAAELVIGTTLDALEWWSIFEMLMSRVFASRSTRAVIHLPPPAVDVTNGAAHSCCFPSAIASLCRRSIAHG